MNTSVWLKISGRKRYTGWASGQIQAFKTKPSTGPNQIAIKVELNIPDTYFEMPELRAVVELPEGVGRPAIDATIEKRLAETIQDAMGFKVHITSET